MVLFIAKNFFASCKSPCSNIMSTRLLIRSYRSCLFSKSNPIIQELYILGVFLLRILLSVILRPENSYISKALITLFTLLGCSSFALLGSTFSSFLCKNSFPYSFASRSIFSRNCWFSLVSSKEMPSINEFI